MVVCWCLYWFLEFGFGVVIAYFGVASCICALGLLVADLWFDSGLFVSLQFLVS